MEPEWQNTIDNTKELIGMLEDQNFPLAQLPTEQILTLFLNFFQTFTDQGLEFTKDYAGEVIKALEHGDRMALRDLLNLFLWNGYILLGRQSVLQNYDEKIRKYTGKSAESVETEEEKHPAYSIISKDTEDPREILDGFIKGYAGREKEKETLMALYQNLLAAATEAEDREWMENTISLYVRTDRLISDLEGQEEQKRMKIMDSCIRYLCQANKERNKDCVGEKTPFPGKGVLYTAVTGGYDQIREPEYMTPGLDYILFTDDPKIRSDRWQVRLIENPEGLDPVRLVRKIKILGPEILKEYDYSIWVDGKLTPSGDMQKMIQKHSQGFPMLCFPHYSNSTVEEEEKACEELHKADPERMRVQIASYREDGFPDDIGLIESAVLIRRHHDAPVDATMEIWWKEVDEKTQRDQLSFPYAAWKSGLHFDLVEENLYHNEYFKNYGHRKRGEE